MTTANIRIIREVFVSSVPTPGTTTRQIAITYQIGPTPPQVIIIPESELPDRVFLAENPDATEVPAVIAAQGDAARREFILSRLGERPTDRGRVI